MTFSQKEMGMLKDLMAQEKLCAEKYGKAAAEAADPQLKGLMSSIGQVEQEHERTIGQMMQGTLPSMPQNPAKWQPPQPAAAPTYGPGDQSPQKANDAFLAQDALAMETHVSTEYNGSIFEFCDENARDLLNHIQKEEQQHGLELYQYLSRTGMYNHQ